VVTFLNVFFEMLHTFSRTLCAGFPTQKLRSTDHRFLVSVTSA